MSAPTRKISAIIACYRDEQAIPVMAERLKAVEAPVLIVVGSLDGMTGVQAGHIIADMLPNATVVELPDTGHYPWVESPEAFRTTVVSFLEGS